ncbi:hypothetical protein J3B02_004297, partial [Coemansia erecta]
MSTMARHRTTSIKPKTNPALPPPKKSSSSTAKNPAANTTGSELRRSRRNAGMPVEEHELPLFKPKDAVKTAAAKYTDRVIAKPKSRTATATNTTVTRHTNGTASSKSSATKNAGNNKTSEVSSKAPSAETPTSNTETPAPAVNFIMSSPKRKAREPA